MVSRPLEVLVEEANLLVAGGKNKPDLQDTTLWTWPVWKTALARLLDQLSEVKGLEWLRLHAYPLSFSDWYTGCYRDKPNICNYMDIRSSTSIQKYWNQCAGESRIRPGIIDTIVIKSSELRWPQLPSRISGETEKEFQDLVKFVEEQRFERLGILPILRKKERLLLTGWSVGTGESPDWRSCRFKAKFPWIKRSEIGQTEKVIIVAWRMECITVEPIDSRKWQWSHH
jgi:hypothetical protein